MQFDRSLGRTSLVTDLTESNVYAHLARRSEVAPATRNKELGQLLALWRFAVRRKFLTEWPDIPAEHEPERTPVAWLSNEVERLIRAAGNTPGNIGNAPANLWWPLLIRLMLDTGERIGAIRDTKWDWIGKDSLLVPAESRKGKTRDRLYRLSPTTCVAINSIRRFTGSGPGVLPWPYAETYIHTKYKQILERAELPTSRKYQTHCLRKTVGSATHAAGMDAQEVLDHSSRRDTKRYLDPRFTRQRQACDVLAEFLSNPTRSTGSKQTG